MSVQQPTTTARELPAELDSPRAKLIFLYLRRAPASIDDLESDLGVRKITLYSILRTLRERDLVQKCDGRFAVVE